MDIALELCDTYIFDHIYAALLPASPAPYNLKNGIGTLASWDATSSPWQYQPASSFISFPPGEAAYQSQWRRDNMIRQILSLYLITW
jgi:lathosterol oxidase